MKIDKSISTIDYLELSLHLLNSKGHISLRLSGYSMYPYLRGGDVCLIRKIAISSLKIGDVIIFKRGKKMIAHRLVRIEKKVEGVMLITKGDTSKKNDEAFSEDMYVGKIVSFKRKSREVNIDSFINKIYGYLVVKTSLLNTPLFVFNKKIWRRVNNR